MTAPTRWRTTLATAAAACAMLAGGCTQDPGPAAPRPTPMPSIVTVAASPAASTAPSSGRPSAAVGGGKLAIASDSSYQVEAPVPMTEEVKGLKGGAQMHHLHSDEKGDVIYGVTWVKLDPQVAGLPPAQLLDGTARGIMQNDPKAKADVRPLKGLPDVPAIIIHQSGPGGSTIENVFLVADGRLYQLMVTVKPGKKARPEDLDAFFDSFSLLSRPQ